MLKRIPMRVIIIFIALGLAVPGSKLVSSVPGALAAGVDSNWGSYSQKEQNPDWKSAKNTHVGSGVSRYVVALTRTEPNFFTSFLLFLIGCVGLLVGAVGAGAVQAYRA